MVAVAVVTWTSAWPKSVLSLRSLSNVKVYISCYNTLLGIGHCLNVVYVYVRGRALGLRGRAGPCGRRARGGRRAGGPAARLLSSLLVCLVLVRILLSVVEVVVVVVVVVEVVVVVVEVVVVVVVVV